MYTIFTRSMYYEGVIHIDGPNYDITKKVKCDTRFLYTIRHKFLPFEWIILSKIATKSKFQKNLAMGFFDNSVAQHDFNFDPKEHGIHDGVLLFDYISLLSN